MSQTDVRVFRFQHFYIDHKKCLGHGSYGAVYKARCDQLPCAAKVLHPTIVDPLDPGAKNMLQKFKKECNVLSSIRHPNIVQYLSMTEDPQTKLPVLLIELLDESLTKMLQRSMDVLPYPIQVDLCHDISLAICYLHSNGIIHRDLSSNNVLVIAEKRAKVTDFGMATIQDAASRKSLTMCPGTMVYMPPEAFKDPPTYTEKMDSFSLGILKIQICTGLWPDPGPRTKEISFPNSPSGKTELPILETERRQTHIELIDPEHPLLKVALKCLSYDEKDRPSAQYLCQELATMKAGQKYADSLQAIEERKTLGVCTHTKEEDSVKTYESISQDEFKKQIEFLKGEVVSRENELAAQTEELEKLVQKNEYLSLTIAKQDRQILLQNRKITITQEKYKESDRKVIKMQSENSTLHKKIGELKHTIASLNMSDKSKRDESIQLSWRTEGQAPSKMIRGSSLVHKNLVYFQHGYQVMCYNLETQSWNILPKCQYQGNLAMVRGLLTVIASTMQSLVSTEDGVEWLEKFPPMLIECCLSATVSSGKCLIVAGGRSMQEPYRYLDVVQVLDTDTLEWSQAVSLPHPVADAFAVICGSRIYILSGEVQERRSKSIFISSVTELLQSCETNTLTDYGHSALSTVWYQAADLPVYSSTCLTVNRQLLAFGGCDEHYNVTAAVHRYERGEDIWEQVDGLMPTARYDCFVVVLPTKEVMVIGGSLGHTDIEIASVS